MAAQLEDAHPDRGAASRRTLQLITVLAPAVAGVLGTIITVIPQLRSKDAAIGNLLQKVERLEQRNIQNNLVSDSQGRAAADAARRLNIRGMLLDSSGRRPLGGMEVFLVPQNKPKLIGQTEPDGSFRFPDMPDQRYRIGVRDAAGKITLGEMDEDNRQTTLTGAIPAIVKYQVEK